MASVLSKPGYGPTGSEVPKTSHSIILLPLISVGHLPAVCKVLGATVGH